MTREEILNMPAGRKMDALIAYEVFEIMPFKQPSGPYFMDDYQEEKEVPHYSTDIAAAWEVFEWLAKHSTDTAIRNDVVIGKDDQGWSVSVWWFKDIKSSHTVEGIYANTAPLAICRATLLAVMENEHA